MLRRCLTPVLVGRRSRRIPCILSCATLLALTTPVLPLPSARADNQAPPPVPCLVEVRLTAITCTEAHDENEAAGGRGEYFLRIGTGAEIGPFELSSGDSSTFTPGLLLDVIDTGILRPAEDEERVVPVEIYISAREADSGRPGEDDTDDRSETVRISEPVACPGGATVITRRIHIEPSTNAEGATARSARRSGDKLKLSIKLTTGK